MRPTSVKGFTLIEMAVVMLVLSIIVTLAYSGYRSAVLHSHRTEVKNELLDLAAREATYFSNTNTYTSSASALGYTGNFPQFSSNGYYIIIIDITNATPLPGQPAGYILAAGAIGGQANDTDCQTFNLNDQGVRSSTSLAGANTTSTCW